MPIYMESQAFIPKRCARLFNKEAQCFIFEWAHQRWALIISASHITAMGTAVMGNVDVIIARCYYYPQ
jgi:hypothetical protein